MKLGGLGSFFSFCKAVCTAASIEKFVNSSIDPETHNYALFEAILSITVGRSLAISVF